MPASVVEGYPNERSNDFFGKDSLLWWIGEVEDNRDPLNLNRVKCRILGWYTNPAGETVKSLAKEDLPWALVLQPTTQAGNDGQGESSGQLQPGAIVMGFFFDGEEGQQPVVMGVLRVMKTKDSRNKPLFALTGEANNLQVSTVGAPAGAGSDTGDNQFKNTNNSVQQPGSDEKNAPNGSNPSGGAGAPDQAQTGNVTPNTSSNGTPAADGVGGPSKTLKAHLQDMLDTCAKAVTGAIKTDSGTLIGISDNIPIALDKCMAGIKNAIMAIAAQAVASMREWLNELAGKISKGAGLIASFTGITGATMILIKTAIELILKQLCILDNQIIQFALNPIQSLEALFDAAIGKAMEYVALASAAMDDLIDKLKNSFNNLLCKVKSIVTAVEAILTAVGAAIQIINAWKSGKKIFTDNLDFRKLTLDDFLQIVILLLNMLNLGCNRSRQNSNNMNFYPYVGGTYCTTDDGAQTAAALGGMSCKSGGSIAQGVDTAINLLGQAYAAAEPYLTKSRTDLDGSYETKMGTPGNQANVRRYPSGTVESSIRKCEAEYQQWKAKTAAEAKGLSKAEVDKAVADANKKAGKKGGEVIIGDHSQYAGAYTVDVAKDLCYKVKGHELHTVDGDFRLKVTGDFHLEVGGGFFVHAVGAPQVLPGAKGASGAPSKAQKHSVCFGSDVDISASGATIKMQATELNLSGMNTNLGAPTGNLGIDSPAINIRGGDIVLTASNTITNTCLKEVHLINSPPAKLAATTGFFANVFGPVDWVLLPALSGDGVIPKYTVTNTKGPGIFTFADLGCSFTIPKGMFQVGVAVGAITMQAAKGAVSIQAGAAMNLIAKAAVIVSGKTISLN